MQTHRLRLKDACLELLLGPPTRWEERFTSHFAVPVASELTQERATRERASWVHIHSHPGTVQPTLEQG